MGQIPVLRFTVTVELPKRDSKFTFPNTCFDILKTY